jgi:hypothetical protein
VLHRGGLEAPEGERGLYVPKVPATRQLQAAKTEGRDARPRPSPPRGNSGTRAPAPLGCTTPAAAGTREASRGEKGSEPRDALGHNPHSPRVAPPAVRSPATQRGRWCVNAAPDSSQDA